jgi:hypothetical protein
VADALDPDPTDASPVRPVVVSEGDLAELELSPFDCVFLCNIGQLTPGEAERLARFAAAGGGVVLFLGDRTRPDALNEQSASLLPARIGALSTLNTFGVDPLEYRHSIVAPFRGREGAGLLTTPVSRYWRLMLSPDRAAAEVVAAFSDGSPWMVAAPLGRGRVVLVATDGSLSSVDQQTGEPWTAWPTWPSFLPLVREMLAYAVGGRQESRQLSVGSALSQRGDSPLRVGEVLDIARPDGGAASVRVESGPDGGVWSYDATDLSGIYTMRAAGWQSPQSFAINVDTAESDLAKVDPAALPSELLIRATPRADGPLAAGDLISRNGWQQPALSAAFGLLLMESLLAWRFGRGVA